MSATDNFMKIDDKINLEPWFEQDAHESAGSDFFKSLLAFNNELLKNTNDLVYEQIVEFLPTIVSEVDNAFILREKKLDEYDCMASLDAEISCDLGFPIQKKYFLPRSVSMLASNMPYIYEDDEQPKLFEILNASEQETRGTSLIVATRFVGQEVFIIIQARYLSFSRTSLERLAEFSKQLGFILKGRYLRRQVVKKAQVFEILEEIRKVCATESDLTTIINFSLQKAADIFDYLKSSFYYADGKSMVLAYNRGFINPNHRIYMSDIESDLRAKRQMVGNSELIISKKSPSEMSITISDKSGLLSMLNFETEDGVVLTDDEEEFLIKTISQVVAIINDFQATQKMAESKYKYWLLAENMPGVVALLSTDMQIVYISPSIVKTTGYEAKYLIGKNIAEFVHEDYKNSFVKAADESEKTTSSLIFRVATSNGEYEWVEGTFKTVWGYEKQSRYRLVSVRGVADRLEAEEHIKYVITHDELTNIPNRAQLLKYLDSAIEEKRRLPKKIFSLLVINVDRFKHINDDFGHRVGDELLQGIAKRLATCVYSNDIVARLGGDEFAILLNDLPSNADAKAVMERIQKEFSRSFLIDDNEIMVSLSIGIAFINDTKLSSTGVLRNADIALRTARKSEDRFRVFNNSMYNLQLEKSKVEKDLMAALRKDQLFLVYQPMFDLVRRRVAGFEALIRWNHPTRGLVSPADFIPVAEESGLIVDIDYWVLEAVAKQLRSWYLRLPSSKDFFVSLNLSARNIVMRNSARDIHNTFLKYDVKPTNIKLEVTEGVLMNNMRAATKALLELRAEGFRIQLDDFGTGYSSLSYIQQLPIDSLKIDQSFIRRMAGGKQDEAIVQAVLALGSGLNLEVVAEGVETPYQLERLTAMNCDYAQGYLIAKPLEVPVIEKRFF